MRSDCAILLTAQTPGVYMEDWYRKCWRSTVRFYRAMHFSAKRGIAIACRLSVRPSVCDVGELW